MTFVSGPARSLTFVASDAASGSEKVASSTRASGEDLASRTARCSATMVLPVPAEPATRAGPAKSFSTISRCEGWRKTIHLSQGAVERLRQFFDVLDDPEPPQRVGVGVWVGRRRRGLVEDAGGGELQQRFRGFRRQVDGASSRKASSFAARMSASQSVGTPTERRLSSDSLAKGRRGAAGARGCSRAARAGSSSSTRSRTSTIWTAPVVRMRLDAPPRRPGVGLVVVVDIGEQQARLRLVQDDADVGVHAHGPKIPVARVVDPVHLQTGVLRVGLQIEGRCLHGLLVGGGEPRQGVSEGVGDAEAKF